MDRKSILILVVAIAVLFVLSGLVNRLYPPIPAPVRTPAAATNQTANPPPAQGVETNPAAAAPGAPATPPAGSPATPPPPEVTLAVSNADLIFHFTSRGGGLKEIALRNTNYPAVVHSLLPATSERNFATLNARRPGSHSGHAGREDRRGDDISR